MRIALVAPLVAPIAEADGQLGGAQVIVADLARGLARRGHDVTLLAASGSHVDGARTIDLGIDATTLRPASFTPGASRTDDLAESHAFAATRDWLDAHLGELDLVHAHAFDAPAFDALRGYGRPVIHTLHLPPVDEHVVAATRRTDALLVTVSNANAAAWRATGAKVGSVVPNGVDLGAIAVGEGRGGYVLHAGRISSEKGPDAAIRASRAAGRTILLVGGIYDDDYFVRAVKPLLGNDARYLGRRPRAEVYRLMGDAASLAMPVHWDEPFGLVALEAQAAGTPVVGYRRGALPEVVVAGQTGSLVEPEDEAAFAAALWRAGDIDRGACRRQAARFSISAMLDGYEEVYTWLTR